MGAKLQWLGGGGREGRGMLLDPSDRMHLCGLAVYAVSAPPALKKFFLPVSILVPLKETFKGTFSVTLVKKVTWSV